MIAPERMLPAFAPVAVCADDFGLSPGVSEGIAELIEMGRLTATSVMVPGTDFARIASRLSALRQRADIGLHLTLTGGLKPLGTMAAFAPDGVLPSIGAVVRKALPRQIGRTEIRAEISRQLRGFLEACGFAPDFIDGHQHVHVLPVIRDALFEAMAELGLDPRRTWLRDCAEPLTRIRARGVAVGKAAFISVLGRGFRTLAQKRGHACNDGFAGVYDFGPTPSFSTQMRRFLSGPGPRPLVMVHPGHIDPLLPTLDPVVDQRAVERHYLASDAFPADLEATGTRLERMSRMGGEPA